MAPPRVLVLYNEPTLPPDHPDADSEHDVLYTADTVIRHLQQAHLPVTRLGVTADPMALLTGIAAAAPDVIFNLYEGLAQWGNTEGFVAGILELLRIPFTGSPTQPLMLCRSKPLTKQLLAGAGLPTAPFFVVEDGIVPPCPLAWPVIVKPGREDASVGIDQKSVCTNQAELEAQVEYIRATYGPSVLVEGFVRGREFNVAVIERNGELTTLPFSEILFEPPAEAPDLWPIVSFDAKWRPGTRDFIATPAKNPAENVSPAMHAEVAKLAKKAFTLVGCRDYARIDFRVDESGRPFVLEVNPNPCISPLAGLAAGLETAKVPYPEFVVDLVRGALRRGPRPELAEVVGSANTETPSRAESVDPPRSAYRVRAARRSDLPALEALVMSADGWSVEDRKKAASRLAARLSKRDRSGWRCLVLAGPGVVFGLASVVATDDNAGGFSIDQLIVDPTYRRLGYGTELLAAAEDVVAAVGGRFLTADLSSAPGFGSARQFLARRGFRATGEVPDYYRDGYARISSAKVILPAGSPAPAAEPIPAGNPIS